LLLQVKMELKGPSGTQDSLKELEALQLETKILLESIRGKPNVLRNSKNLTTSSNKGKSNPQCYNHYKN